MRPLDRARPDVEEGLVASTSSRLLPQVMAILTAAFLAGAGEAIACTVCYGQAEGDVISGAKLSIVFLGALVYGVIGGGLGVLFALRRRVRRSLDPHRSHRLVHSETRSP
jgi:hypothetical protein